MRNSAKVLPAAVADELAALYGAGDWPGLVIAADLATARYPGQPLGWKASGKALLHLGKIREAIGKLTRLVKLAPADADAYNDLGNALHALGRGGEALAQFRRAARLDPRSSEPHANLGHVLHGLGRFEEAAACCRRALTIDPASAAAHNNLGAALLGAGRAAEAAVSFRQALALRPDYLDAHLNLGRAQEDLGQWVEAKASYRRAVLSHPDSPAAHSGLGQLLSRLTGEDAEAGYHLERAIALNAGDAGACLELGNVLMRSGRRDDALTMFRHGQRLRPLTAWRANRDKAAFSVLFLDTPLAGSTPVNYLAGRADYDRHFLCVLPDGQVDIGPLREKAGAVFNMICNPDDGADVLLAAADIVERLGRPTINHPRQIANTGREAVAARLAALPGCIAPRTIRASSTALLRAAAEKTFPGFEPPGLVRTAGTHGGDDFVRIGGWDELAAFVSRNPRADHYLIEYIDYRSQDDLFRKYRVIFIDGEIYPYHLAIHDDWKVHYFRTDMENHAWMRHEEERFLADIGGVFDAGQRETLRAVAKAAGVDYGGADCGIGRDGRIVVFEANAAMLVHDEKDSVFAYKNPYIAKIKTAFDAMLARRARR